VGWGGVNPLTRRGGNGHAHRASRQDTLTLTKLRMAHGLRCIQVAPAFCWAHWAYSAVGMRDNHPAGAGGARRHFDAHCASRQRLAGTCANSRTA
jgi:hypothetical protein